MSYLKISNDLKKTIPWQLVMIFLVFTVGLIVAGGFFYISQRDRIYREQENNLSAIASLKIGQIQQWHSERLGDASIIEDNETFIRRVRQYFRGENRPEIIGELKRWMVSLNNTDNYRCIMLLDTAMKLRFSYSLSDTMTFSFSPVKAAECIRSQKIIMTDILREPGVSYIHIDIFIPLKDTEDNKTLMAGLVILRIDPWKKLFPLIQSWPTPSKSSETLLLRKDRDSILFLNDLRHLKNTALNLRMPVSKENLLASKAVRGIYGIVEGVDYRNIPVVGYASGIPGLPWFMVAKTDKEELNVPIRRNLYFTIFLTILLVLINFSVFGFWLWEQKVQFYRQQLNNERERKKIEEDLLESEERLSKAYKTSPISFMIANMEDGRIIEVNDAFTSMSGFTREEVLDSTTLSLNIWVNEEDRKYMITALSDGRPLVRHEILLRAKNGNVMTALLSAQIIHIGQKNCIISSIEDITERKKAEDALRESEDKFKYVFDNSVIGKSITLPDGEIHVNKAFCDMLGYKKEELEKTKWQDISHPDDIKSTNEALSLLTSGVNDSIRFTKRYIQKNGSIVWADVSTSLRRDKEGNPLYFMTAITDITEHRHSELERNRLLQILESSLDEIYVFNSEDLLFEYVNQGALRNLGYTMDEMKRMTPVDLKPEYTHATFRKAIKPLLDNQKKILIFETVHRRANKSLYPVEVHLQVVEIDDQKVFLAVIINITSRKEAEKRLSFLSSRHEAILASVPDIIMEVDNNLVYTWANQSGKEFFGEDVIGKEADFYFEGEQNTYQVVSPLFKGNTDTIYVESWQRRRDSEKRLLGWSCRVMKDENGNITGALSSALDITERNDAEIQIRRMNEELEERVIQRTEQLAASNKELEAFSYSVSHDLRAPLRAIHGYTNILLEEYEKKLDKEGKRILGIVSSSATQMGGLIDDLLSFSRIGRSSLNPGVVDMKSMARSVFEEITGEKERERINLKIGRLHKAFGDSNLIKHVWNNLISNAIKYSSKETKSKIIIISKQEGDKITYSVKDNGVGFDMQYAHKLFGVFQRLHSESEFEGNGVGLAIVQRIILKHGGKVWAVGKIGKGATFYFSLPSNG